MGEPPRTLVIGGGPAGIAAVLALRGRQEVVWVDPSFSSGRLARFHTVACNTKVDLLLNATFFQHPLLEPIRGAVAPALDRLKATAQPLPGLGEPCEHGWTDLDACKEVYDAATEALLRAEGVVSVRGFVRSLERDDGGDRWIATVHSASGGDGIEKVAAQSVIFATGSEPRVPGNGGKLLCGEDAFERERLRSTLRPGSRVAVVGNSHSAAIVLANLKALAEASRLQVANFVRSPLRLAEWVPDLSTYRYTSSGLKGFGADFGQEHMKADSGWLEVRQVADIAEDEWDYVIDCTGYAPSALPTLDGESAPPDRDPSTSRLGRFRDLYAVGAPWGEFAGQLWGAGQEEADGFKGESLIGFHMFFARAALIAEEIGKRTAAA